MTSNQAESENSATNRQPIFEISDGSIAFGGNQALESVSFAMSKGQLVGLIGPNGSGKTTLLNATSGIYPLNTGTITFEGDHIEKSSPHQIARAGIARTFQIARIFPQMTALENMLAPAFAVRDSATEDRVSLIERARGHLDFLDIAEFAHEKAADLSGGQRMLLQFARALMLKPRLMLLDEPFGALDAQVTWEMEEMVIEIIESESKTVVLVTHDIQEAIYLADRIIFFTRQPGRIKADLPMEFKGGKRFSKKEDLLSHPGYIEMEKRLYGMMREEIQGRIS